MAFGLASQSGYNAKGVNRISKFRRSNQVYLVPWDKRSQEYQRFTKWAAR